MRHPAAMQCQRRPRAPRHRDKSVGMRTPVGNHRTLLAATGHAASRSRRRTLRSSIRRNSFPASSWTVTAMVFSTCSCFQVDLRPHARRVLRNIRPVARRQEFPSLVDARFELPRDVAWKSDRIAFRIYGPALAADVNNGVDVWVKRVRSLIVDKWYKASAESKKDTYHEDHGEGASISSAWAGRWVPAAPPLPGAGRCINPAFLQASRSLQPDPCGQCLRSPTKRG